MPLNDPQMLPAYIREMAQMQELLQTEQAELDRTEAAILDATDQLYINSATWTLSRWEQIFGLPTNDSVPVALRREKILSKRNGDGLLLLGIGLGAAVGLLRGAVLAWLPVGVALPPLKLKMSGSSEARIAPPAKYCSAVITDIIITRPTALMTRPFVS